MVPRKIITMDGCKVFIENGTDKSVSFEVDENVDGSHPSLTVRIVRRLRSRRTKSA